VADHSCGCKVDARHLEDRCDTHALWECHKDMLPPGYGYIRNGKQCPACFRAQVKSVAVGPGISKLAYERVTGRKKVDMRGRENY
jgi:hypothetical protein